MQRLSSLGMVHHGGRSVAKCGPVASEIGKVIGLLAYITQNSGLSACFATATVHLWCLRISSREAATN
jgi:hypothetical protein